MAMLAGLLTAACVRDPVLGGDAPASEHGPVVSVASPFDVPGRLYLLGGPEGPFHMDLYLDDGDRLRQITTEARVSWVSASDERVVVAAAPDRTDQLFLLEDGELVPLPGLDSPRAFSPEVSDRGVVAYQTVNSRDGQGSTPSEKLYFAVHTWDLHTEDGRVLFEGDDPLGPAAWGPDGQLAVVSDQGTDQASIIVVAADGSRHEFAAGVDTISLEWGRYLALSDITRSDDWLEVTATVLADPTTGEHRHRIEGWAPLAWSPDRDVLLVADESRLGLVGPDDYSSVQPLGGSPIGRVYGAAWSG